MRLDSASPLAARVRIIFPKLAIPTACNAANDGLRGLGGAVNCRLPCEAEAGAGAGGNAGPGAEVAFCVAEAAGTGVNAAAVGAKAADGAAGAAVTTTGMPAFRIDGGGAVMLWVTCVMTGCEPAAGADSEDVVEPPSSSSVYVAAPRNSR